MSSNKTAIEMASTGTRPPLVANQYEHNLQINQHLYQMRRAFDRLPFALFWYENMFKIQIYVLL